MPRPKAPPPRRDARASRQPSAASTARPTLCAAVLRHLRRHGHRAVGLRRVSVALQDAADRRTSFVGLENYADALTDPLFLSGVGRMAIFLVVQVPIMIALALFFALALTAA